MLVAKAASLGCEVGTAFSFVVITMQECTLVRSRQCRARATSPQSPSLAGSPDFNELPFDAATAAGPTNSIRAMAWACRQRSRSVCRWTDRSRATPTAAVR